MNVRNAILKAADSIERMPGLFDYYSVRTADPDCGTPGCALGWIATHLDIGAYIEDGCQGAGRYWSGVCEIEGILGIEGHMEFYSKLDETGVPDWRGNPSACTRALRLYADKYHPADKPNYTGIPDSVLALFAEKVA